MGREEACLARKFLLLGERDSHAEVAGRSPSIFIAPATGTASGNDIVDLSNAVVRYLVRIHGRACETFEHMEAIRVSQRLCTLFRRIILPTDPYLSDCGWIGRI